jgi:ABC-type transport system involved in multi-copper enzyme maturation permease subunit
MWKILGNIIEMFVYSAVYMIIVLVGATFSTDFEKKISEEGHIGLSLICACVFIGFAILLSSLVR